MSSAEPGLRLMDTLGRFSPIFDMATFFVTSHLLLPLKRMPSQRVIDFFLLARPW